MARRKHRFGSPPQEHRVRGVLDARRAIKLARKAQSTTCNMATGLLITAAKYAGQAQAEARGMSRFVDLARTRTSRAAIKTANRAEAAVHAALKRIKARCIR